MNIAKIYRDADGFQKLVCWTFGVTYFLIFVGGLVRAAGAGLGCPDWPRCFGLWIPPLTADALPPPYDPAEFNVFKTWLEYVNRLVGVTVGLLILATFFGACRRIREAPLVFAGAAASLVMVLFQGWLGGQVVRSGLEGWMITIHMIVAVLILNVLLFTGYHAFRLKLTIELDSAIRTRALWAVSVLIGLTLLQVALGAQVREALSAVMQHYPELARGDRLAEVGSRDLIHRSFSWLIVGASIVLYRTVGPLSLEHPLRALAALNNSFVVVQILIGIVLAYGGLPPAFQIFHLVVAAGMTSVQFLALLIAHAALGITGKTS